MTGPWDPGLQPERTELAWRRTALSLAAISLVAVRLLPMAFGSWLWVVPGICGVLASGLLWWASRRRNSAAVAALRDGTGGRLPDARLLLATVGFATIVGITGLLTVLR